MKRKHEWNVWERSVDHNYKYQLSTDDLHYFKELAADHPKFYQRPENNHLELTTKRAALKVSPSVVSLTSYSDGKELFQASGVIIERITDNMINSFIVLTSLNLIRIPMDNTYAADDEEFSESETEDYYYGRRRVSRKPLAHNLKVVIHAEDATPYEGEVYGYSFYYNILVVKFTSTSRLVAADLKPFTDGLSLNLDGPFPPLRAHSQSVKVVPGDKVIAIGRYFSQPFEIMAAPGCFSADRCNCDCKEFCRATCNITQCGDGGPVINTSGQVIGIGFKPLGLSIPFLPINVASSWWSHYKNSRESRHLSVGLQATSLYLGDLPIIERVRRHFPDVIAGVFVEQVRPDSFAADAGLKQDDIILECCGRSVDSFLELFGMMWEKFGESVELVVARAGCDSLLTLTMMVAEAAPVAVKRWPCVQ